MVNLHFQGLNLNYDEDKYANYENVGVEKLPFLWAKLFLLFLKNSRAQTPSKEDVMIKGKLDYWIT